MIAKVIISILAAYLLGSIPTAYLVGRMTRGIDIREVGDGRIGASFMTRRLGLRWGIVVGFTDFCKGALAVILAHMLVVPPIVVVLCGVMAVVGHDWSIFMGFRGGRGAATTFGALAALMWWHMVIAFLVVIIPFYLTRKPTLFTVILFCILPVLLWIDSVFGILPALPWPQEISPLPLLIASPLIVAIPWLLKRPVPVRVVDKDSDTSR